jgi:aspartate aminotransferase-like enzyme
MIPGPTYVPERVREAYLSDVASSDVDVSAFFAEYSAVQAQLRRVVRTESATAVLMMGEGMLALWSALKSTVRAGDRVFCVGNGLYGFGIADMARSVGCEVQVAAFEWNQVIGDDELRRIDVAVRAFRPTLVTVVHCETPSGVLNRRIADIGRIARDVDALYYVDFVSAAGGAPVDLDASLIDLGLLGTQKVISAPPSISIVFVNERAWSRIEQVNYVGYDALWPWREPSRAPVLAPYTFDWSALKALNVALTILVDEEGIERAIERHDAVARLCRQLLRTLGLRLFIDDESAASPTITAFYLPEGVTWQQFDAAVREHGVVVSGTYGQLENKVVRIGHMGSQATVSHVERTIAAIGAALAQFRAQQ